MPAAIVSNNTTSLDGTALHAASTSKYKPTTVDQGPTPYQFDLGLLTSINPNTVSSTSSDALLSRARDGVQALVNQMFTLPITRDAEYGPLAALPPFTTKLPREKSLPKPKPMTKWEKFAKQKGIQSQKKDKMIYDENIREWVPRWGYKGANKDVEDQWIHEIKHNQNPDMDPAKTAKKERLAKQLKNEKQRLGNMARAAASTATSTSSKINSSSLSSKRGGVGGGLGDANAAKLARMAAREKRKAELEADVLRTRASTASMGRFDKTLKGEQKQKGIKRKFDANEKDVSAEREGNLALLNKLGTSAMRKKAANTAGQGDADLVNTRKAVQFATNGHGITSMRDGGKRGGKRGRK
ncbi:related to RRS1 - regulator of ribosome biogenesis [Melanopsichium pennsylvanicum]|uniref:Ribosome biogenesis regulatory protein n=2 Tax=Melanopsichium pennsylvanicum TaxID=63383 RepID=A0AAJ4XRR9_9BASI|nr:related to RRS1-regulator of ribosome biogenesis [Melanopsichium pennsylvanicum 4]SNX87665.1 related to RRS1 - regulator of ribosome biogenesis [Melanopsichium pennsylvanicum]